MEYTHLGRSGLRVSRLCLGTMNFGPLTPAADAHRLAGIPALALLALVARTISELALAACGAGVVAAMAAADRLPWLPHPRTGLARS
jgi:hypothetical protein